MALIQTKCTSYFRLLRPFDLHKSLILQRFLSSPASFDSPSSNSTTSFSSTKTKTSEQASTQTPRSSTLPYRIIRTPSSKLPIYEHSKSGGTRKETKLRKIEGDIDTLRVQLRDTLNVDDKDIKINRLTRHIIVKGWRKLEVAKFLEKRQF